MNSSHASKLPEEMPIIRRSRSLSELPGHIRVPILRRQDTARTQARLEAGAAGVQELRVLREHQQQVIDQTMSDAHQKRKQPTQQRLTHTMAEHHRLQPKQHLEHTRQQMHSCCFPISTWHSTNHLASISEERDSTPNDAAIKYFSGNSVNVSSSSNYQETTKNTFANKKCIGKFKNTFDSTCYQAQSQSQLHDSLVDKNKCNTQHHSLENNLHYHKVQNHSQEKSFKSSTVKTEEQTSADKHKIAMQDETAHKNYMTMHVSSDDKESKTTNQYIHTNRSRSMSQGYIQCRDNRNAHNLSDICLNQNMYMKSAPNLSRGRSQSVNANFEYFCNSKENESECKLPHQSSMINDAVHKAHNTQPGSEDYVSRHMYLQDLESLSNINSSPFHPLKMFSSQSQPRSKSISWDNLLVVIGLQNENSIATNEVKDEGCENNDDVFRNSAHVVDANNEYPTSTEIENGCVFQIKKMRSQSFTSGYSLNPNYKSGILKIEHGQSSYRKHENVSCKTTGAEDNENSKIGKRHSIQNHRPTVKEVNSISLLRRASIQCEAVLTQTGTPKRILNPLQDVDINSLQSPGPLHAVTLQYTSVPMRKTSDSCAITTSNKSVAPKEKPMPQEISKKTQASCSAASSHAYQSLHLVTESGYSTEQLTQAVLFKSENSKLDKAEPCNSKIFQQNAPKDHPIPRPRTSVLKASSQQASQCENYNTATEISEMNNKTPVILNETLIDEDHSTSRDRKSDADQLQNSVISDHPVINSSSPSLVPNQQPTYLTVMKGKLCSNLKNQRLHTKSQNKELPDFIQNTDPSCSVAESGKTECCSVAVSGKVEVKTLKEQDSRSSNILEILSIWVNSHRVNKANSDLNGGIQLMKPGTKSMNKSVNASTHAPSCHFMVPLNEVEPHMPKAKTNGSKSSICLPPHQKQFVHTPDVTILSDEGYSTCDSISQQSQLFNCGTRQPSDVHSPSNGSIANMGSLGDLPYSPDNYGSSFKTQCLPTQMDGLHYLKCEANKETRAHYSDIKNAGAGDNGGTECYSIDPPHHNVKQDNSVISERRSSQNYGNSSAAVNHSCHSTCKETVVATKLSSQVTSTNKHNFEAIIDNNKDSKDGQINTSVVKLGNKEHNDEEIKFVSSHSNDSVQSTVKDITLSFKQTAV